MCGYSIQNFSNGFWIKVFVSQREILIEIFETRFFSDQTQKCELADQPSHENDENTLENRKTIFSNFLSNHQSDHWGCLEHIPVQYKDLGSPLDP